MEILPYFLTSPEQHAFDLRTKTSCEAQAVEREGLSPSNEQMGLMGLCDLYYGSPQVPCIPLVPSDRQRSRAPSCGLLKENRCFPSNE